MKHLRSLTFAALTLAVLAPLGAVTTSAAADDSAGSTARVASANPTTAPPTTPTTTTGPPTTPAPTDTTTPVPTEPVPTDATEEEVPTSKKWHPKTGVIFNEPRQSDKSHKINRQVRNAIINSKKGSQIRLVTWNFDSALYMSDVIRAHKRGVSVQMIMANGLAQRSSRYWNTKKALEQGNKKRPKGMESWFRTCKNSCRGVEGIQHGKWFMFSRTGGVDKVVMSTSANLTDAAAYNQWNDLLTVVGRDVTWDNYTKIFKQMSKDKPRKPAYYTFADGPFTGWFNPQMGPEKNHNVMKMLNKVRCKGARGEAGKNGTTVIRVGQAVFNGKIGSAIAGKLAGLKRRGCNIKMVYGVLNNLSRARMSNIPKKYILQDTNNDGFVDRYIHMKALTISGVYDGKRSAHVVYQGSSNWSGMSTLSDEQGFIVQSKELEQKYSRYINGLYKNPPPQGLDLVKFIDIRRAGLDPFKNVRREMGIGKMQPAL